MSASLAAGPATEISMKMHLSSDRRDVADKRRAGDKSDPSDRTIR